MPNYRSPGVYVEEIDAGPKPIQGVATSVAGAVGVTARGPSTGKPELVTSFAEFVRKFGSFLAEPSAAVRASWEGDDGGAWWTFPLAVKGFFDNGGEQLFVKRVFSSNAAASTRSLRRGLLSLLTSDAAATATTLRVSHVLGIGVGTAVSVVRNDATGAVLGPFNVTAYDHAASEITLSAAVGQELKRGRDYVVVHATGAAGTETLRFDAISVGGWGDALEVRVRPMEAASYRLLESAEPAVAGAAAQADLTADADAGDTALTVAASTGFATGDRVRIGASEYELTAVSATSLTIDPAVPAGGFATGTRVRRMQPSRDFSAPSNTLRVWGAASLYRGAILELDTGTAKEVSVVHQVVGDVVTLESNVSGHYYAGHLARLVEATVDVRYAPGGTVEVEETFTNLRLVDDGSASYLPRRVNDRSQLVRVQIANPANFPLSAGTTDLSGFPSLDPVPDGTGHWIALAGGGDAYDSLSVDDFVGRDGGSGNRTGIQALEDIDDVAICMVPGMWSPLVHVNLLQHCESLKDRFAILDVADGLSIADVRTVKAALDSKYGALYYPWLVARDPSAQRDVRVAPSGHMAGIYARVDTERGVHKAPANEVIRGIRAIAQDVTRREQDLLNPEGINALRRFPGRGDRVWGARTLSSDGSWKYINVRRLFLFIEESIDEGTQWVVFEPNDERLWARVRQTIRNFLLTQWRAGALQGETDDEAFFVRCDRTTMTQDDIDNGRLICEIGIAPVKPAEFVIFRIQQKTLETEP